MAKHSLLRDLMHMPWQVSVVLAAGTYALLKFIVPSISYNSQVTSTMFSALSMNAYLFAIILLFPAPFAFFNARRKRRMLDEQSDIDSIKQLSWYEFEQLLGEYYRRNGYRVLENTAAGPDGGIDLLLKKDEETTIVQCKQYRHKPVGVKVVREMFGLKVAHGATHVVIVTACTFTRDAKKFAQANDVQLVDSKALLSMIQSVQSNPVVVKSEVTADIEANMCPRCGSELVERVARRGNNAGNKFLGCSAFPKCRFVKGE